MVDQRVERLARVVVDYCLQVEKGQRVALFGSTEAESMMRCLYRQVMLAGGYPYPFLGFEVYPSYGGFDDIFFKEATERQLQHVFETEKMVKSEFEGMVVLRSQRNTRSLANAPAETQRIRNEAYADLQRTYLERTNQGELSWVVAIHPTHALAQEAEMDLESFEDFVYRACRVDREGAVGAWRSVEERQQRLVDWLEGREHVQVQGPNVDMTFSIEGRTFFNSCGKYNLPDGEIFTGPVESSVEGWVRFTYPAVRYGTLVEGVELRFDSGRIVEATADRNQDFLHEMLATDEGARHLGEWAIGTNERIKRFSRNTLFDEKIAGTIHMALGSGIPQTGSQNDSAIHWDMITDMRQGGQIIVDGDLLYEDGRFLVG